MKTIKKQLKRAFTIVELVIVIAVIAVLAAVLIPTFVNVINSANVSNDTALAKNMNTTLTTYGTLKGKPETPHEALEALEEDGYLLKNMTPTADGYSYIWDQNTNSIALITEDYEIQYSQYDDILTNTDSVLWVFVSTQSQVETYYKMNTAFKYCVTSDTALTVYNDFDSCIVANANTNTNANVTLKSDDNKTFTIYTDGGEVTINAANATVNHYGDASLVTVTAVDTNSYHVYGEVKMAVLTKGRLVVEDDASISILAINASSSNNVSVMVTTEEVSDAISTIYVANSISSISVTTSTETNTSYTDVIATEAISSSESLSGITYVSTNTELEEFISGGMGIAILQNDVTISSKISLSSGQFMMIDLNGYTLISTHASSGSLSDTDPDRNIISGKSELTISNGNIEYKAITVAQKAVFIVETGSKMTLNNVEVDTTGSFLFPKGDAAEVNVINSSITTTDYYCVATNAGTDDNYNVVINLKNSTFTTDRDDGNPIYINVAGKLNIDSCKIYGQMQGVGVRAGEATITNTVISCSIAASAITSNTDMLAYTNGTKDWGSNPKVAMAAVYVGNDNSTAYKADAKLTMSGCTLSYTITDDDTDAYSWYEIGLYVIRENSTEFSTTVTISNTTINGYVVKITGSVESTECSNTLTGYSGTIYTTWSNNAWTDGSSTETENE